MPAPLQTVHVTLALDQLEYHRLKAAHRHLTVSALLREMIEKERSREDRTARRQGRQGD